MVLELIVIIKVSLHLFLILKSQEAMMTNALKIPINHFL